MAFDPAAYQTTLLDQDGSYRAFPLAWTLDTASSGAVSVHVRFAIGQKWHPEAGDGEGLWSENYQPGFFVDGWFYIVKKDGEANDSAAQQLIDALGWDGDMGAFEGDPPFSTVCIVRTGFEAYNGQQRLKLQWLSKNEDRPPAPGGLRPADPSLVASLNQRFGGKFKALAGGAPQGTAPAPPATNAPDPTTAPQGTVASSPPTPPTPGFPGADTATPGAPPHDGGAPAQESAAPAAQGAPAAPSPQGGAAPSGPISDDEVPF